MFTYECLIRQISKVNNESFIYYCKVKANSKISASIRMHLSITKSNMDADILRVIMLPSKHISTF